MSRPRLTDLPPGWAQEGRGRWVHENGACVTYTGRIGDRKYEMRAPDGIVETAPTRDEAFAWGSGEILDLTEGMGA